MGEKPLGIFLTEEVRVGDKVKFTVPPELGYGERGASSRDVIPLKATLVFAELILHLECERPGSGTCQRQWNESPATRCWAVLFADGAAENIAVRRAHIEDRCGKLSVA